MEDGEEEVKIGTREVLVMRQLVESSSASGELEEGEGGGEDEGDDEKAYIARA